MSESAAPSQAETVSVSNPPDTNQLPAPEPQPSFTKLAMRNMVKKGGKSLFHFGLTAIGLLGFLVGLSYLTR